MQNESEFDWLNCVKIIGKHSIECKQDDLIELGEIC